MWNQPSRESPGPAPDEFSEAAEASFTEELRLAEADGVHSLRRRFVLALTALVAVVLLALGSMLLVFGHRHLRGEIETRVLSYATLATDPVLDAFDLYFDSGRSKFYAILREIQDLEENLEELAVYDIEGRRLMPEGEGLLPERLSGLTLEAVQGLEVQTFENYGEAEDRLLVVVPWVEEWGRHRYSAVFLFSYKTLGRALFDVSWTVGLLALFALALGVACAFLLSAWSLGPVAALTRGARRMAEGDLEHRIDLRTDDEFEVLGATLDLMARRLAETFEDLEASNDGLARLNRELRELDRVKSDLLANVSHELRTPLTAIAGYVEAMSCGLLGELEEDQRSSLVVVERNIRRLRGMIDQLLNYSRMESGQLSVELAAFDLGRVARHVVEAVRTAHGEERLVELHQAPDLPEVYGDSGRIAQVLENLLTNGIKFSDPGETVRVDLDTVDDGVEVRVTDRGIGIPPELQGKIFERFYQVDGSARRRFGGMGIGLALVREILELNHSQIHVESEPGQGATFRFTLPLANERTGLVPLAGRPVVALVDDDTGFVQSTASHLVSVGFSVETAASTEQGWALLHRVRPDVVLLDRLLPDGDGFDLLKRLRRHHHFKEVPVLLVTVRRERALGLRLGASAYLHKPLTPQEVEEAVRGLLAPEDQEP